MQAHDNSKLRSRAEKLQRLVTVEEAAKMTPEEVRTMIQELQIYQIELEMQNHQLAQTTAELEQARNKYVELYDTAPFGYLTLGQEGLITEANRSAAELLNLPRLHLQDKRFSMFVHPDSISEYYGLFRNAQNSTTQQRTELKLVPAKGEVFCAQVEAVRLQQETDTPLYRFVFLDITEQKKASKALEKNEQLLSGIFNSSLNGIQVFKAVRDSNGVIDDFKWVLMNHTAEAFMQTTFARLQPSTLTQEAPDEVASGRFARYVQVVETGITQTFTAHFKKKDREHWLNCVALKMDDGFVLTTEDVTQQHQAHEQLKDSQHLIKTMAEAMPDFLYVEDLQLGRNVYNNRDFLAFLGYTAEDIKGHPRELLDTLLHPEDAPLISTHRQRFAQVSEGDFLEYQVRVKAKDGTWHTFNFRETVFKRNARQEPIQLVGTAQDITQRLRAEQELRQMHETVSSILRNLPIILWRISADGIIEQAVGSGLGVLGYQDHALEGTSFAALNPSVQPHLDAVLAGGKETFLGESEINGQKIYKQNFFFYDEATKGAIGFCLDVTEQKNAEAEARHRTFLLDQLLQNLPLVLAVIDLEGKYLEIKGKGLRSVGIQDNELVGKSMFEIFPILKNNIQDVLKGEVKSFTASFPHNGQNVHFQNFGFLDPHREIGIAFGIDITEQKVMQDKLMTEKEFSEKLLENSIDGIFALDQDQTITAWNKTLETIMGKPRKAVLGQPLVSLFPEEHHEKVNLHLNRVLEGHRITLYEIPGLETDRAYEVNLVPFLNADKEVIGALGVIHDITLQKQRQQEETQYQLNQQKAVANAVLSAQEEERKRIAEALHNSLAQLLYAAKLNLEDLIQTDDVETDPTPTPNATSLKRISGFLEDAIKETRTLAHELIPKALQDFGLKIALRDLAHRLSTDNFSVQCVVTGFEQKQAGILETALYRIVQELLNNAIKHASATEVLVQVVDKGHQIMVRVEDNGVGMPSKAKPNSSGMGLATIQNRVKLLQGRMRITSNPEEGTVVTIHLNR